MSNRLDEAFRRCAADGRKAFVGYLTAGQPVAGAAVELAMALAAAGVDVLELGLPFSDPVADGPVNTRAAQRSLAAGFTPSDALAEAAAIRAAGGPPLVLFTYLNPLLAAGGERFLYRAAAAGFDGLLVVDLPPEEAGACRRAAEQAGLRTVFLAAPTTPDRRLREIAAACSGFLYYACQKGTTGERERLPGDLAEQVARVRSVSDLPVCVGFGIGSRPAAAEAAAVADGFVVGSAFGRRVADWPGGPGLADRLAELARSIDPNPSPAGRQGPFAQRMLQEAST